ncbi:MAG: translation initiation factor IF-2 [Anaerohalosphaeraceae bacterium]|nr:translation initiation factor IF-2 [Anaerohalosphaeraceae bacterium]
MANTRVHILAKELGVKSKAIVEKCQAEGLDIKNHMSTISAGLAATILEWFSEGEHSTTIETAERVDLKKVRIKKKKVKKTKEEPPTSEEPQDSEQVGGEEKPQPEAAAKTQDAVEMETDLDGQEPDEEPSQPAKPVRPKPVMMKHRKPTEPVKPAGPMLERPKPARLNGPTVIRVEEPEPEEKPKPRAPRRSAVSRPAYQQAASEPLMASSTDSKFQKKSKKKTHGRRHEAPASEDAAPRTKGSRKLLSRDIEERRARLEAAGGEGMRLRPKRRIETKGKSREEGQKHRPDKVQIAEPINVRTLASALMIKTTDVISKLFSHGIMANINQVITADMAELIAIDFEVELEVEKKQSLEQIIAKEFKNRNRGNVQKRTPVVTMLGHVDHGKTSLLDKIRSADVAAGEAGGITQHIGAYQITLGSGDNIKKVTFLDTPGHEAFTAMRARGANMTNIVVLVVAADDGLMPQTIEAIHHAKAADVAIIVALNKIDLPGVDINRIYGQLAEHELTPAEWGGNTEIIKTSAITGQGIEDLIEHLDYAAELLDLKADSTIDATGWVVEARMSTTHGATATLLIDEGKLKKGDIVFAGPGFGRIRTLRNSNGRSISSATSAMPVEISGINGVPQAGDRFYILKDLNRAKSAAEENKDISRQATLSQRSHITLENLFSQIEAGKVKEVNVIIRADVQGSVDVLNKYLMEMNTDEVQIRILHSAVGGVTEGDVVLAEASGAIIIGFNVVPDDKAARIAEGSGVDIRLYSVIYRITEDLKKAMSGLLEPEEQFKSLGKAIVRNTFKITGTGTIAGCFVEQGEITRNAHIRLIRDSIIIQDRCEIQSLKHFKEDVRKVKSGLECGIKIVGFDDVKIGDVFEVYEIIKVQRTID